MNPIYSTEFLTEPMYIDVLCHDGVDYDLEVRTHCDTEIGPKNFTVLFRLVDNENPEKLYAWGLYAMDGNTLVWNEYETAPIFSQQNFHSIFQEYAIQVGYDMCLINEEFDGEDEHV